MKKLLYIFTLSLLFLLIFCLVACSPNEITHSDSSTTSTTQSETNETNKPVIDSDVENDKGNNMSQLSTDSDGFYFTYNDAIIKLPIEYSSFMQITKATALEDVPKEIFSHESKVLKIKLDQSEATIVVMGKDFNKTSTFDDALVISIEAPFTDNIIFKKNIKNTSTKGKIFALYGKPSFTNTSSEYEYLYYALPNDSFDDHKFGLEITIFNNYKNNGQNPIVSFKYGSLNNIEYMQH